MVLLNLTSRAADFLHRQKSQG